MISIANKLGTVACFCNNDIILLRQKNYVHSFLNSHLPVIKSIDSDSDSAGFFYFPQWLRPLPFLVQTATVSAELLLPLLLLLLISSAYCYAIVCHHHRVRIGTAPPPPPPFINQSTSVDVVVDNMQIIYKSIINHLHCFNMWSARWIFLSCCCWWWCYQSIVAYTVYIRQLPVVLVCGPFSYWSHTNKSIK